MVLLRSSLVMFWRGEDEAPQRQQSRTRLMGKSCHVGVRKLDFFERREVESNGCSRFCIVLIPQKRRGTSGLVLILWSERKLAARFEQATQVNPAFDWSKCANSSACETRRPSSS